MIKIYNMSNKSQIVQGITIRNGKIVKKATIKRKACENQTP